MGYLAIFLRDLIFVIVNSYNEGNKKGGTKYRLKQQNQPYLYIFAL